MSKRNRERPSVVERAAAALHVKPDILKEEGSDQARTFNSFSTRITTLAQLIEVCKVDLEEWKVERYVVNKWEAGARHPETGQILVEPLFQVKAWLVNRNGKSPAEFRRQLIADMEAHAPTYRQPKPVKRGSGLLYEISIFDHHLAKLCWHKETGTDYDLKIAREMYAKAVEDLVSRVQDVPLEGILFPVGNDFFHVDNASNTTTRGTIQDVDDRWQKAFLHGREMVVEAVDLMREVAPVEVVVVPGNHDTERMFYLGDTIASWYRNDSRTRVDNSPPKRKYKLHGVCLLGFTHGDEEKHPDLPRLMADEVPELWAKSKHREWHLGHFHKKKEMNFVTTDTHGKTIVRVLPSLTGVDAWHKSKGYAAPRGSEAYLWSKEKGYLAHYFHGAAE